jgi:hypothetical protein
VAHKSANGRTELGKHKKEESQGWRMFQSRALEEKNYDFGKSIFTERIHLLVTITNLHTKFKSNWPFYKYFYMQKRGKTEWWTLNVRETVTSRIQYQLPQLGHGIVSKECSHSERVEETAHFLPTRSVRKAALHRIQVIILHRQNVEL